MVNKPTYEELEQRIEELEKEAKNFKRAEALLFQEKYFSESILESLPGIFYFFDDTGKLLRWNKNLEKVTGYLAEEIKRMSPLDFFEGEDKQNVAEKIQEVFIKGESVVEADLVSKNSQKTPYYFTGVLIQIDNKKHLGGMGINIVEQLKEEIAERRRAEDTLRENEARLSKINECFLNFLPDSLNNINQLTSLCGKLFGATCSLYNRLNQGILYAWGQWNTPFDYNPVDKPDGHICYDVIKSGVDEVVVIPDLQNTSYAQTDPNVVPYKLQTYIGKAVKFGDSCVGSLCVVFQDDYVPNESDKKIIGIIASAIGVEEERRQAEEALQDSEALLGALSDASFEAIFLSDKGVCLDQNQAAERMFGYGCAEAIGRHGTEWIVPEDREQVKNNMLSGYEKPYEVTALRKDGTTFPCEIQARMIKYLGRTIRVTALRDITERKRAEEELRKAHDELEIQVNIRTAELAKTNELLKSEIEERKGAELTLIERSKELENKTHDLEEVNAALNVLLKRREQDKADLEEKVLANVKEFVFPYIEKLNNCRLSDRQMVYLNIINSNLKEIIAPFLHRLSSKYSDLTPREIQIAGLVKDGKTTKEIAELLNSSKDAIDFHRNNLRKKLGLRNTKTNLRSFLLTFT